MGSVKYYLINTFIEQGCIKLIKRTVKLFIMLQKISISNFMNSTKILTLRIRNVS